MTAKATQEKLISESGLFDRNWYLREYPDVARIGMDPITHYLDYGARMQRNPGPDFDTKFYLDENQDVARSGMNPLVHYIKHGRREHRRALPSSGRLVDPAIKIDVIVPVFNALPDVKRCLQSVVRHRDGLSVRVLVVNDGSGSETTDWLRSFAAGHACVALIESQGNLGYTRAINSGLRESDAPYIVAINSDTVVSSGWLRGMLRCMNADPGVGVVGPLSNAASWQSVPDLRDADGQFAINDLGSLSVEEMSGIVRAASRRRYPKLPFVNGFCFMMARPVLESVGLMDEEMFPVGYGEENDYCIRALDAGFKLAIADDVFVYHAKSRSFGHDRRKELSRLGAETLIEKHSAEKVSRLLAQVRESVEMDHVRRDVRLALAAGVPSADQVDMTSLRILFLLPVQGGGGGAHSVVQESCEMRRMNVEVKVAVPKGRVDDFISQYPEIPGAGDLFIDMSADDFIDVAGEFDVVIGTIYRSMSMVSEIVRRHPNVLPAYYVQDYEPLFFPEGSPKRREARASYGLVPNCLLFAKTAWIIGKVKEEHGLDVARVHPSIDHDVYYPARDRMSRTLRMSAMIRPQTPYRGAQRTMRVFKRLSDRYGDRLAFDLFGCDVSSELFSELERGFSFVQHGKLSRAEVADLLRKSDLFVDLSDYQAFGRTALEAMACGCVSAITWHGGADEYAVDGVNALLVDSLDEESCFQRLSEFVDHPDRYRDLRLNGIESAAAYSVHRAAVSVLSSLVKEFARQQRMPAVRHGPGMSGRRVGLSSAKGRAAAAVTASLESPPEGAALTSLRERYQELARLTGMLIERERVSGRLAEKVEQLEKENAALKQGQLMQGNGNGEASAQEVRGNAESQVLPGSTAGRGAPARNDAEMLRNSSLFDGGWYLARYPEIAATGVAPEQDYLTHGARAGRDPGPDFNTSRYLKDNPDVVRSGMNPLVHFLRHGITERRRIFKATVDQKNG